MFVRLGEKGAERERKGEKGREGARERGREGARERGSERERERGREGETETREGLGWGGGRRQSSERAGAPGPQAQYDANETFRNLLHWTGTVVQAPQMLTCDTVCLYHKE